jgi:hypothetical protein
VDPEPGGGGARFVRLRMSRAGEAVAAASPALVTAIMFGGVYDPTIVNLNVAGFDARPAVSRAVIVAV